MITTPTSPSTGKTAERQPKRRSTCDACQEAKTRCSHDMPRCYRCQSHNIACVYGFSRRMGRPRRLRTNPDPNVGSTKTQEKKRTHNQRKQTNKKDIDTTMPLVGASADAHLSLAIDNLHANWLDVSSPSGQNALQTEIAATSLDDKVGWHDAFNLDGDEMSRLFQEPLSEFGCSPLFDFLDDPLVNMMSDSSSPSDNLTSGFDFSYPNSAAPLPMDYSYPPEIVDMGTDMSVGSTNRMPKLLRSTPSAMSPGDAMLDNMESIYLPTSDIILNGAHPSSSSSSHMPLPSSFLNDHCNCYVSILQHLSSLDSTTYSTLTPSLDIVLQLEQHVQQNTTSVLRCETCSSTRPSLLLLLAVTIDNVVGMLEAASSARSKSQRNLAHLGRLSDSSRVSSNTSLYCLGGAPSTGPAVPSAPNVIANTNSPTTPAVANAPNEVKDDFDSAPITTLTDPSDTLSLTVGSLEILADEKTEFLKQLLRRRLAGISTLLKQLRAVMMQDSNNRSARTGLMIVSETVRRLRCVVCRVELWDC